MISLYAIKALKHLGYQESPIKIIFSGNEEKGHQGSTGAEVFLQEGKDCLFAFNMETGLMDGCLCVGRKGHLGCRVTVEGVESHAGNDFEVGPQRHRGGGPQSAGHPGPSPIWRKAPR